MEFRGSWLDDPGWIVPGHQAILGTRIPPSQNEALPPLNGPVDPPSTHISTCGPWSDTKKTKVLVSRCRERSAPNTSPTNQDISFTLSPYNPVTLNIRHNNDVAQRNNKPRFDLLQKLLLQNAFAWVWANPRYRKKGFFLFLRMKDKESFRNRSVKVSKVIGCSTILFPRARKHRFAICFNVNWKYANEINSHKEEN